MKETILPMVYGFVGSGLVWVSFVISDSSRTVTESGVDYALFLSALFIFLVGVWFCIVSIFRLWEIAFYDQKFRKKKFEN